jgi:thiamine-monophosphate kinase
MKENIIENEMIKRIAGKFPRAPYQTNKMFESDAELIYTGGNRNNYLAITMDTLCEEIASGLYDDPYLMGWLLVMANFSDIAAVGADPLGLLVSVNYTGSEEIGFINKISSGISDACSALGTFVLGGDTNQGRDLFLSGCALGQVPKKSTITRIGAAPGDKIFLSGPAGLGNIYAFLKLQKRGMELPADFYRPKARIKEGKIIRQYGSCCMDTSDGVIISLDTLMRLNRCQFILYNQWRKILHGMVLKVCHTHNVPSWLTLAGIHGEFELCFTLRPENEKMFLQEAAAIGWKPIPAGEVCEGYGVSIKMDKESIPIDTATIRNLSHEAGSDPGRYIQQLLQMAKEIRI